MKKKKFYEFSKILMIALIMSFSFLIAGIVGINVDYAFLSTTYQNTNTGDESFDDSVYETLKYTTKNIGQNVETVGSGTEEDPYIISNIDQFLYLTGTGRYSSMEGVYEEKELPEGYTQVDYISASHGVWLDTEYTPNENTRVKIVATSGNSGSYMPLETGLVSGSSNFQFIVERNTKIKFAINNKTTSYDFENKPWNTYEFDTKGNVIINDQVIAIGSEESWISEDLDLTMYIYGINSNGEVYKAWVYDYSKLYSYKIYEGETLVKDFVPCKNTEGLVGLYDVVNDKFHGNKEEGSSVPSGSRWGWFSTRTTNAYIELADDLYFNDGYFDDDGVYHDGGDGVLWDWNKNADYGQHLSFKGVFDGKGYTIYGLYGIHELDRFPFFFHTLNGATIKNVTFKNTNITFNGHYIGALFNNATDSLFENVKIYGLLQNPNYGGLAGFVYKATNTTFKNCENHAKGQFCGYTANTSNCKFISCLNYSDVKGSTCFVGGANSCYFEDCVNYGDLYGGQQAGIFSCGGGSNRFYKCKNYGDFKTGSWGGGITSSDYSTIDSCVNYGDIYNGNCGIVGGYMWKTNATSIVSNCKNYGNMVDGGAGIGFANVIDNCENYGTNCTTGISMINGESGGSIITNCINYADVKSAGIGYVRTGGSISGCINYGRVNGTDNCGGISASVKQGVTIVNCINYGKINDSNTSNQYQGAGGIVGSVGSQNVTIKNCKNYGYVYSYYDAGGIVGCSNAANLTIIGCQNQGTIDGFIRTAGIIGVANGVKNLRIIDCESSCLVNVSDGGAGGIIGDLTYNCTILIKNTKSSAVVMRKTATTAGGKRIGTFIGGYHAGGLTADIENCLNTGKTNYTSVTNNMYGVSTSDLINCIEDVDLNGTKSKQAFGKDFSGFYWSWRTGKIGIRSIDGNGLFQGDVNAEYLQKQGFEGGYMSEEPDSGNDLYSKYTQLEYIESTGTQYIDSGVKFSPTLKIETKYELTKTTDTRNYVFGLVEKNNSRVQWSHSPESFAGFNTTYEKFAMTCETGKEYNLHMDSGKFILDGTVVSDQSGQAAGVVSSETIRICAAHIDGAITHFSNLKLYSFNIADGENLIRSFVPAKRNADGAVGLYDRVEGKFYENKGTGSFVAGNLAI